MKNTHHPRYARHRFPAEVISYAVWLYFRFPLRLRMVEENSHQPTRRRDRIMKRFKSAGQAQRFLSVHDQVANLFRRSPTPRPLIIAVPALGRSRSGLR